MSRYVALLLPGDFASSCSNVSSQQSYYRGCRAYKQPEQARGRSKADIALYSIENNLD